VTTDGGDDTVEGDRAGMEPISPPATGATVDVWGMEIPTEIPGDTLHYEQLTPNGPMRFTDEWDRVWYSYHDADGELKTKQRAVSAVSNRRRRRPRRRRGTCRVGYASRRRAGVSRFTPDNDPDDIVDDWAVEYVDAQDDTPADD